MYEEIMRRLENIRIIRSEMPEYEWQAIQEFWEHVESDLRWAMAELARFHKCDGFEVFLAPDGENGLRECSKPHYHKVDD